MPKQEEIEEELDEKQLEETVPQGGRRRRCLGQFRYRREVKKGITFAHLARAGVAPPCAMLPLAEERKRDAEDFGNPHVIMLSLSASRRATAADLVG